MRAMLQTRYGGPEVLEAVERDAPTAGEGEIVVRVAAAGVDAGSVHMLEGRPAMIRMAVPLKGGRVPGTDVAGIVHEVGPGVRDLAVGDAVFGVATGSLAEFALARADRIARRPDALTAVEAAALPVSGSAAWRAVRAAGVEGGHRVLVTGAGGGVGHLAVQFAKAAGAEVVATCSAAKARVAEESGADEVVDYGREDPLARGPFDAILDAGGHRPVRAMRRALALRGALVIIGSEPAGAPFGGLTRSLGAALGNPFVRQRLIVLTSKEDRASLGALADATDAGTVRPIVDREYSLDEAPDALRRLGHGAGTAKSVVRVR